MYIVCLKETSKVIEKGVSFEYRSDGYPRLTLEDGIKADFPVNDVDVFEVSIIPQDYEDDKYCYTPEAGFYLNPDWKEPTDNLYGLTDEQIETIEQAYRDKLTQEVRNDA